MDFTVGYGSNKISLKNLILAGMHLNQISHTEDVGISSYVAAVVNLEVLTPKRWTIAQ